MLKEVRLGLSLEPSRNISKDCEVELYIQSKSEILYFSPTSQICWKWFKNQICVFPILNTDWQQEEKVQGPTWNLKELHYLAHPGRFTSFSLSLWGRKGTSSELAPWHVPPSHPRKCLFTTKGQGRHFSSAATCETFPFFFKPSMLLHLKLWCSATRTKEPVGWQCCPPQRLYWAGLYTVVTQRQDAGETQRPALFTPTHLFILLSRPQRCSDCLWLNRLCYGKERSSAY